MPDTPSLPEAVGAYLKARDDLEIPFMSPSAGLHRKAAFDAALADLRAAYAQIIPETETQTQ